jgi:hypothetical protein
LIQDGADTFRRLSRLPKNIFCADYRGREACFKVLRERRAVGLVYVVIGTGATEGSAIIWNHRGVKLLGQWQIKGSSGVGVLLEILPGYLLNWKVAWISRDRQGAVVGYSVATAGGIKRYFPVSSERTREVVFDKWIGLSPYASTCVWTVERVLHPFRRSFPRAL